MARILLAAGLVLGVAGSAAAVPFEFSTRTDREAFLNLAPDIPGVPPFTVFVEFFDDAASARIESEIWGPALALVLGMGAMPIEPMNVSDYVFDFDLSGSTVELLSAQFAFSAVVMIPIDFTNTTDTLRESGGTKTAQILPPFGPVLDNVFCDPFLELTCTSVTPVEDYDPLTGRLLAVGTTRGSSFVGSFDLFLSQPARLSEIPEPASVALLAGPLLALAALRRRRIG